MLSALVNSQWFQPSVPANVPLTGMFSSHRAQPCSGDAEARASESFVVLFALLDTSFNSLCRARMLLSTTGFLDRSSTSVSTTLDAAPSDHSRTLPALFRLLLRALHRWHGPHDNRCLPAHPGEDFNVTFSLLSIELTILFALSSLKGKPASE